MKNIKKSNVINYDFTDNEIPSDSLKTFAQTKKNEIHNKRFKNKFNQNNSAIVIMVILIMCLIGLCSFTIYQIYKYENKLNTNQRIDQNVNTNSTTNNENTTIITADGFSFVLDNPIPKGYTKKTEKTDFEWIKNKKSFVNSYTSTDEIDTEILTNGIVVSSVEFDNKYSTQEFAKVVVNQLGSDFSTSTDQVFLPNNITAYKINSKNPREKITYYTVVTATNYYVIKVYTQGIGTNISEKADYAQKILTKIRLN